MNKDVVIVGAGTGGLAAAFFFARAGFSVALAEANSPENFGHTWLNDTDVDPFYSLGLPPPLPHELAFDVTRPARLTTTDREAHALVPEIDNYALCMSHYQKRLAAICENLGVEFFWETRAKEVLAEKGFAAGIRAEDSSGKSFPIPARLTVLACGSGAPILSRLPDFFNADLSASPGDRVTAVCEIYAVDREKARRVVDMGLAWDNHMAAWCGMPGAGGFSTLMVQLDIRRGIASILGGSKTQFPGVKPPRAIIDECRRELGFTMEKVYGGGAGISLRYPADCLAKNGLALVGEAGHTTCPANGSGTVPSMTTAHLLAKTAGPLLAARAPLSEKNLWPYSKAFLSGMGSVFAGYYVTQKILADFSESDVQDFLRYGMLRESDFYHVHETRPVAVGALEGLSRLWGGRKRLDLVGRFMGQAPKIELARRLYKRYPKQYAPQALAAWQEKRDRLFGSVWAK